MAKPSLYTIGHSTRTLDEFTKLLKANGVQLVADVRTIPRSRHVPQFNKETLPGELKKRGIEYIHIPELGGLRRALPDSVNKGWRNASFRGYADYMQTSAFEEGMEKLLKLARGKRVAVMCAEAVPWRCHRSLIADALLARGIRVEHILGEGETKRHELTPFARVKGYKVTYPPERGSA